MQIKNRQKLLTIIAVAGLVLLVINTVVIRPLVDSWKARNVRIAELEKSIADGNQRLASQKSTQARWDKMQKSTFPAPQSQTENEMLKAFDRWSQESQVSVSSIKPQWKQTDEDYATLVCRADLSGSMEALSRFIYEVEKDPLALRVEAVEITSHDNDGQQLTLGLQVSGLLLTPNQE